ncbi:MAG: ATP-binding protein [Desulfatirhabdiaceae bacterium]
MILMGMDPAHPHHPRLKRIEESIQSGSALTSQLLGFARGGKYQIKPVNLNTTLRETARMFGRTRKEIVIREQYDKCIWTVEADVRQMEQVFLNLFVNAFHAMPGGGDISLMTQNHFVRDGSDQQVHLNPGKYVKISVTDNGTGMDEKIRRRIFDPFFTTKSKGRGTGLGLTSAYGIITNHGGVIDVMSKPGNGTTFTVYLPASNQEPAKEEPVSELFLKGDETVLVVDDEAEMIEVMQDMLHALGYLTLSASTGKMAIDLYHQHQHEIGLVILDMIMPETGGREAYEELKKINPEIRVLLCSGYSTAGKAEEILNRGCNGFIQKPFNAGELSIKLREILDGPGHSTTQ